MFQIIVSCLVVDSVFRRVELVDSQVRFHVVKRLLFKFLLVLLYVFSRVVADAQADAVGAKEAQLVDLFEVLRVVSHRAVAEDASEAFVGGAAEASELGVVSRPDVGPLGRHARVEEGVGLTRAPLLGVLGPDPQRRVGRLAHVGRGVLAQTVSEDRASEPAVSLSHLVFDLEEAAAPVVLLTRFWRGTLSEGRVLGRAVVRSHRGLQEQPVPAGVHVLRRLALSKGVP